MAIVRRLFNDFNSTGGEANGNELSCLEGHSRSPLQEQQSSASGFTYNSQIKSSPHVKTSPSSFCAPGGSAVTRTSPNCFRVPSDSDSDIDYEYGENHLSHLSEGRPHASPVPSVLQTRTQMLQQQVLAQASTKRSELHSQLDKIEKDLNKQLRGLELELKEKQDAWRERLARSSAAQTAERQRRLVKVQQQQAAQEQQAIKTVEEARQSQQKALAKQRQEQEAAARRQAEEQQRQLAEAAARRAEEEAKAKQDAEAAAAAAAAAAQAARPQGAAPAQALAAPSGSSAAAAPGPSKPKAPPVGLPPGTVMTSGAAEYEAKVAKQLAAALDSVKDFIASPQLKQQRRSVQKRITVLVSSISGTIEQVKTKSRELVAFMKSLPSEEQRTYACITLANSIVSQCDGQVSKINTFSFPLAFVCVSVGAEVPLFMEILLGKLHKVCIFLVPKYYMFNKASGETAEQYYLRLGFRREGKEPTDPVESHDVFAGRMGAYILLFASIVQTEWSGNPLPLGRGWTYLAWLLNALPVNRWSAIALANFLLHAGYRMHTAYKSQFMKLLQYVEDYFVPAMKQKDDHDAAAVLTRLQTYISQRHYLQEPEGMQLPEVDESTYWAQRGG